MRHEPSENRFFMLQQHLFAAKQAANTSSNIQLAGIPAGDGVILLEVVWNELECLSPSA